METVIARIPPELAGKRLDKALCTLFPEHSRSRLQRWVKEGRVTLDGRCLRPKDKVLNGQEVRLCPGEEAEGPWEAQPLALPILHEDKAFLVIDKPPGLVVHPAPGHRRDTLINALLHHAPELAHLPRAGIVHRLDKDTSGLMVVARTFKAHTSLVRQLQARAVKREYQAIVLGTMVAGGRVDAPIGRHAVHRTRMAVTERGKPAITHYRVIRRFPGHTHLHLSLETGRTHQIRVHMRHIRHPLVGDPLYGGKPTFPPAASKALIEALQGFRRQALHAFRLSFDHPLDGRRCTFESPLPEDMTALLALLDDAHP